MDFKVAAVVGRSFIPALVTLPNRRVIQVGRVLPQGARYNDVVALSIGSGRRWPRVKRPSVIVVFGLGVIYPILWLSPSSFPDRHINDSLTDRGLYGLLLNSRPLMPCVELDRKPPYVFIARKQE